MQHHFLISFSYMYMYVQCKYTSTLASYMYTFRDSKRGGNLGFPPPKLHKIVWVNVTKGFIPAVIHCCQERMKSRVGASNTHVNN